MKVRALYDLFGGKCVYCGRRTVLGAIAGKVVGLCATKDHDVPRCRLLHFSELKTNEVLACHDCNVVKSDMTGPEFISFRQTKRFPASYIAWLEQRAIKRLRL